MTRGQELIVKYLRQRNCNDYLLSGDDKVVVGSRVLTVNIYGDIMDASTKKIIADAYIENDLDTLGHKLPNCWKERSDR